MCDDREGETDVYLGIIDYAFLETIDSKSEPWTIDLKVGQVCIRFKIDTGTDVSVISENVYLKLGKLLLEKYSRKLSGP